MTRGTIAVAGAGMSGLVAAARLRELGHTPQVHERGTRIGGSMLLSSCVIWRHREWSDFRAESPTGEERLQRLVYERLDDAVDWLVSLGAEPVWDETANTRTVGKRFDPRALATTLGARAGRIDLGRDGSAGAEPTILCTGGFGGSPELVTRYVRPAGSLRLRANPWSQGDGLRRAVAGGGGLSDGMDEFYGRNMPDASWDESQFVELSQLYAKWARIFDEDGVEFFDAGAVSWSETNVVQATARRRGARAYYLLTEAGLAERVRERRVAELVAAAPAEAAVAVADLPFPAPPDCVAAVRVVASITHTVGGIRIDDRARVLRDDGSALDGLWAAGVDAGGVSTGGYASGLAQALVLGLAAAEDAAR